MNIKTPILELDFSKRLEIRINNEQPVMLADLTVALLGVSQQFEKFIENEVGKGDEIGSGLFVKEVRSGSIVVELVAQSLPLVSLLWSSGSLGEWLNYSKSVIDWLSGKASIAPKNITKQDLRQWNDILEPVAKDQGSQMVLSVSGDNNKIQQIFVSSSEANAVQNRIRREIELMDEPDNSVHRKCVMTWYQAKFDNSSDTGNKAIIEAISDSPIKVIFENNAVKRAMMAGSEKFSKPWHELAYIVDVKVQTIKGQPKVYTIMNYYDEDTFDPEA
ncbi:hypothetical protein [Polynucleobacter sp. AP-Reno-20A-A9]|uniref:hypothetical protein n=1 Tax=Polynucleobacter sp. AP-Reno-20A-A9 TaxID=2576925 RepID=UPI001C0DB3DA|nr:hypothetical protein [Polynucleobacter sp. AP-Reno-20A-A9]MBU3627997.1 hypothetical protein [Polynucleobacter sp. AP-Reno-20A-A9]